MHFHMKKKMDLESFDVFKYIKHNFFKDHRFPYILVNSEMYRSASIRFPHRNFFYGIGLTFSGESSVKIANRDYCIKKGSLIMIGPGVVSQWLGDSGAPTETILFTENLFQNTLRTPILQALPFFLPGGNHIVSLEEADFEKMKTLFVALRQFEQEPNVITGITHAILTFSQQVHELAAARAASSYSAKDMVVHGFNSLVAKHFLKNKDVGFYADSLNISPKYLSEILLAASGKTAKALIDDVVFMEAKSLLRQTTMTVQEIAIWLGYTDTSYFTKAFKAKEGYTPQQYRKL